MAARRNAVLADHKPFQSLFLWAENKGKRFQGRRRVRVFSKRMGIRTGNDDSILAR